MFVDKNGMNTCKKVSFYSFWLYLVLAVLYVIAALASDATVGRAE